MVTNFARNRLSMVAVGVALMCATTFAAAQSFPTKPIRLIVPYAAGGAAGVLARAIADRVGPSIGQP
ncbi:MAG: tripartite tricarboxylate transporter substrate binding protein, partial [Burkholderiales bacterium]